MPEVIVAGAGVAGLSAAHRLLERGFDVTLVEADDYLGGKLGASRDLGTPDWSEHCFHMYLNWYNNFWAFVDEIGVRRHFLPMPAINYLKRDQYGKAHQLTNIGSPWTMLQNVFNGVSPPADNFIYMYSLFDLVSKIISPQKSFEQTSVLAFMASRPYMTDEAMNGSKRTLAEAFACPSYLSSARSYRSLVKYGLRQPDPTMWLLNGNTHETLFVPWRSYLERRAGQGWGRLDIQTLRSVQEIGLSEDGERIERITVGVMPHSASRRRGEVIRPPYSYEIPVPGDLILAIPPKQLGRLVSFEVMQRAPGLADVRKLLSEPMISLDLYFKRKLPDVPAGITLLLDSRHDLSFLDQSQIWRDWEGGTFLNLIASDADTVIHYSDDEIIKVMVTELKRFLRFDDADLDEARTHLKTNIGEELVTNQVGSWHYRPSATTSISNLFIAGDFCQSVVDVVTIEGAVVTGLLAAEAIRCRWGFGRPITIIEPEEYPTLPLAALAAAQRPLVYAAKAISTADTALRRAYQEIFPNG